ncbi:unnamed protein product [Sphagnum compactum]
MNQIVIDARESGTSTGRYIDKLIEHLYAIAPKEEITLLTKEHRIGFFKELSPGYTVIPSNHKEFTFDEQLGFLKQLRSLKPRLVHFDPDKIVVTYESADKIADQAEPFPELNNKPFLFYVGRPTPHKNLERLIAAFRLLKPSHPQLTLVLGGKTDSNYSRIAQGLDSEIAASVIFTDRLSEGQLRWMYENCQAYIFPSLSEGFGLPGLEAMQHGAPVISSKATCLPEVYGSAAAYFDPLDIAAMAKTIAAVIDDQSARQKLITLGHTQVARYSWQTMAEQTLAVYKKVLNS